jgi:hypothetical protein
VSCGEGSWVPPRDTVVVGWTDGPRRSLLIGRREEESVSCCCQKRTEFRAAPFGEMDAGTGASVIAPRGA